MLLFIDPKASPRQRPPSPARSPNDVALRQIIAEKTKLEGESLGYKSKIKTLEGEVESLKEKVSVDIHLKVTLLINILLDDKLLPVLTFWLKFFIDLFR